MLGPTHLMFALALAYIFKLPRVPAAIGGLIPDLDIVLQYGFPFMHRGIVHTPFFLVVCVVFLYLIVESPVTFAFGTGFLSHLLMDIITPSGIPMLYPLPVYYTLNLAAYNNIFANLGIIAFSLAAIMLYRSERFQDWVRRAFGITLEGPGTAM